MTDTGYQGTGDSSAIRRSSPSLVDQAATETERVFERLEEGDDAAALSAFGDYLGGMVFWAAQKLIDAKGNTGESHAIDEAIIISCSRLFNDWFAADLLLRRGIVVPGITLLRSLYEVVTQSEAFFEKPELAEKWLAGQHVPPRDVRRISRVAAESRELYGKLSRIAHANAEAFAYHGALVSGGTALSYGGSFRPKAVGQIRCQLLWALLTFLYQFYRHYSPRLVSLGLLWRDETKAELLRHPSSRDVDWELILSPLKVALEEKTEYFNKLPNDSDALTAHLNDVITRATASHE